MRIFEFRVSNVPHFDHARLDVDDSAILAHGQLLDKTLTSERGGRGLGDLLVVLAAAATDADRANHLATAFQRQAASEDHYSAVVGRLDTVEFLTRLGE